MRGAPNIPAPPGVTWWTACYAYEGVARELVARAKYRNERRLLRWAASTLAAASQGAPDAIDCVTWAPASAERVRHYGVDHGEVLARAVANARGSRAVPVLDRVPGPA